MLAQLVVGQEFDGEHRRIDRVRHQPALYPARRDDQVRGAASAPRRAQRRAASLNVGSRSYINGFDQDNGYSPASPGFVDESAADPNVLFTSIYDDLATTTLVPDPINVTGETAAQSAAKLVPAAWGSVGIQSGAIAVINAATFQYGGGRSQHAELHHSLSVGPGIHH